MRATLFLGALALVAGCGDASIGTLVHEGPVALPEGCIAALSSRGHPAPRGAAGHLVWVDVYAGAVHDGPPLDAIDMAWDAPRQRLLALERGDPPRVIALGVRGDDAPAEMDGLSTGAARIWPVGDGALVHGPFTRWTHVGPSSEPRSRLLPRPLSVWDEPNQLVWLGVAAPRVRLALVRVADTDPLASPQITWLEESAADVRASPSVHGPALGYLRDGALVVSAADKRVEIPTSSTELIAMTFVRPRLHVAVLGAPPALVAFDWEAWHASVELPAEPAVDGRSLVVLGEERVVVATDVGLVAYDVDPYGIARVEWAIDVQLGDVDLSPPLAGPMPCPSVQPSGR